MDNISHACKLLEKGELIGMPTETVYGLAADAFNLLAVASIFTRKKRPKFNPLIVHGYDVDQFLNFGEFSKKAFDLANFFWPGPLTIVLKRLADSTLDYLISAGMDTVALRIPSHQMALDLLREFKKPIVAPSANLSNSISPTTPDMVFFNFPDLFVLNGGNCSVGLESTIIGLFGEPVLLRPGIISKESIEKVINEPVRLLNDKNVLAPGMMKKHYSPKHPLRLNAHTRKENEVLLGFGNVCCDLNLSLLGSFEEAASNLYTMMFDLDNRNCEGIAVSPIPIIHPLGIAINDRLTRAATSFL